MEPVGLGVKPQPDALTTIGGMMNIANTAQAMQQRELEIQKSNITLNERLGIQRLFQNASQFTDANGQPDYNKLINEGMKVAPTTFPLMVPQIISAHKSGLDAQAALNTLDNQSRDAAAQFVMGLGDNDPATAKAKLDALSKQRPQLKPFLDFAWNYHLAPNAQNPESFKKSAMQLGAGSMAPSAQLEAMTPAGPQVTNQVQTGTMNLRPMAGPVGIVPGSVVNQQLPLGERQTVSINPVTQTPMTVSKDAFGNVLGATVTPSGPGVPQLQPGDQQAIPQMTEMRGKINEAANAAATQRFNNKQIIELAPKSLAGTGGELWSKIFSANGLQYIPGDQTRNFQQLAHFMALQAQANSAAMGAGTDLARSMAEAATGSTSWTPAAIVATAKINDALAVGLQRFNDGMEKAITASGGNVLAARDFRNKWAQAFDPDVYRYGNALESGDAKEIDHILGPKGSKERAAKAAALAAKSARLNQLVTTGQ